MSANELALHTAGIEPFGAIETPAAPRAVPAELIDPGNGEMSPFVVAVDRDNGGLNLTWNPPAYNQAELAYQAYARIPEIRGQVRRSAAIISRCSYDLMEEIDDGAGGTTQEPSTDQRALDTYGGWVHPNGSPKTFPKMWAKHVMIAGRVWIAGMQRPDDPRRWEWKLLPFHRVRKSKRRPKTHKEIRRGTKWVEIRNEDIYLSEWKDEDPADETLSDSPIIGVAQCAMQVILLDDLIKAVTHSHINYGILKIPIDSITAGMRNPSKDEISAAVAEFKKAVTAQINVTRDACSPEGTYAGPMVITGLGEHLLKASLHESLKLEFTEMLTEMLEMYIRRIARGMDGPPEQLLGKGELSEWGSYNSDADQNDNTHSPLGEDYAWHVTTAVLRRWLCAVYGLSAEEAMRFSIACNDGEIKARQDLSKASREVNKLVPLKERALAQYNGLDPDDIATDMDERREWWIRRLIDKAAVTYKRLNVLLPEFEGMEEQLEELLIVTASEEKGGSPDVGVPGSGDNASEEEAESDGESRRGTEPEQEASAEEIAQLVAELAAHHGFDVEDVVDELATL